jgi:hypothetical protein
VSHWIDAWAFTHQTIVKWAFGIFGGIVTGAFWWWIFPGFVRSVMVKARLIPDRNP